MRTMTSSDTIALIEEWTETRDSGFAPLHEVRDQEKYADLVASMEEDGWIGAPIVVHGEQALTGSHRFWAAAETGTEIPRIEIEDLCDLFDIDWEAHCAEWPNDYDCYIWIAEKLPAEVVEYLGLDIH